MKLPKFAAATALTLLLGSFHPGGVASAQEMTTETNQPTLGEPDYFYRPQELSLDAFGTGSVGQSTINHLSGAHVEDNGRLGAGLGVNYFFLRYLGVGAEAYSENTADHFIDNASASIIGRLPIGNTGVAPYVFAGAGHQFDPLVQTFGHFGGGVEFRFMRHAGFFVDARYVVVDRGDNFGLGRGGFRFNF